MVQALSDAASVVPQVQDAMRAVDPDLPLYGTMTMDQLMAAIQNYTEVAVGNVSLRVFDGAMAGSRLPGAQEGLGRS